MPKEGRWSEKCDTCGGSCANTGTRWIDGGRICGPCRELRNEDIEEIQDVAMRVGGQKLGLNQLLEVLKLPMYDVRLVLSRRSRRQKRR